MRTCKSPGCDETVHAKDLCKKHFQQSCQNTCIHPGCKKKILAKSLCSTHYSRFKKTGSTELIKREPKTCKVPNCKGKYEAKGFCEKHYDRFRRTGSPNLQTTEPRPQGMSKDEIIEYVLSKSSRMENTESCITIPDRYKGRQGRPTIQVNGKSTLVSRLLLERKIGRPLSPIEGSITSSSELALHSCDNPECINIDHLFLGTQSDNMKDMHSKNRGPRHPIYNAKLSENDVLEIRKRRVKEKLSYSKLGRMFNVTPETIYRIIKRKRWSHI